MRASEWAGQSGLDGEALGQATFDPDLASGQGGDDGRINGPLGHLDPFVEGGGGVAVEDRHGALGEDRAGIDALVHEVDRAAGDFDAIVEGLFPGGESSGSRKRNL